MLKVKVAIHPLKYDLEDSHGTACQTVRMKRVLPKISEVERHKRFEADVHINVYDRNY
jgi:phosphoribosylformylglycinamidine (FGAM) synthase PurS component